MSLGRFSFSSPCKLQGTEDLATPDMQDFAFEIQRRIIQNQEALIDAIKAQVLTDSDILPVMNNGASEVTEVNIMTTTDVEDAKVFAVMWNA